MTQTSAQGNQRADPRGRKRDAALKGRILKAGMETFITDGWRGFSLDTVAKAAGAGKSSIYLRYPTREDLFVDMQAHFGFNAGDIPTDGSDLRENLRAFARRYAEWLDGPAGMWSVRVAVESRLNPDFAAVIQPNTARTTAEAHKIIRRAKRNGELPRNASAAVMLDSLIGGLIWHIMIAPAPGLYRSPEGTKFVDNLVENIIRGAGG